MTKPLKLTKADRTRIRNYFRYRRALKGREDYLNSPPVKALSKRVFGLYSKVVTPENARAYEELRNRFAAQLGKRQIKIGTYGDHIRDFEHYNNQTKLDWMRFENKNIGSLLSRMESSVDYYHPHLRIDRLRTALVGWPMDYPMMERYVSIEEGWAFPEDKLLTFSANAFVDDDTDMIFASELFRCGTWDDAIKLWPGLEASSELVIFRRDRTALPPSSSTALTPWTAAQRKSALKQIATL